MQTHNITPKFIIAGIFLALLFHSCGITKPEPLPALKKLPETAFNVQDSLVKPIDWENLFVQEDLKRLIDTALQHNLDLKTGVQRVLMANAHLKLTRAQLLPSLNAHVSGGLDKFGDYTMNGVGNYDTNFSPNINNDQMIPNPTPDFFAGFRSSWEIDIWGKLSKRKQAAYHRYLASKQGLQWYKTQLVSQIAEMYYEMVALDKKLEILKRNITLQERGLEIIEAQLAGGRATALAVSQFKAQLMATKGKQFEIKQAITAVENGINTLLGQFPTSLERDTAAINKAIPQKFISAIQVTKLLARPDIQEAELELKAAKADVAAARKAFLPSLSINAYAGYHAFRFPLLFSPGSLASGFLGGLTAPIFNRAELKNNNLVANAGQLSAFYNYQNSIIKGYEEVSTQLSAMHNFQQAYQLKAQEVAELKQAVASANDLYLAGYASYLEVIVAQASVLNAEMEQVDLKKASFNSIIGLFRSLGG